jgi:hypothetical protein
MLVAGAAGGYFGLEWLRVGAVPAGQGCQREVARLRRQRGELLTAQARLGESLRLERESAAALRKTLDDQAARIAELERDLAFFRHLARSAAQGDGQLVQGLYLYPAASDRRFRFRVTLVRPNDSRRNVKGMLTLAVSGVRDGRKLRLAGKEADPGDPHPVNFRYFQVVEGVLELPSGFEPHTVAVTFRPKKGGSTVRLFPWRTVESVATDTAADAGEPER